MSGSKLIGDCPTVVGLISSTLQSGGSIDTAIRHIAEDGPKTSRKLFEKAVRAADVKEFDSLTEAISCELNRLDKNDIGYCRAISMAISASGCADAQSRDKMLSEASEYALESVKEAGEAYGASLAIPSMMIFGIGIMVPMILMSIVPMLGISGMMGPTPLDNNTIAMITLAIIPGVILAITVHLRDSNPFLSHTYRVQDSLKALPLLLSIPLAVVMRPLVGNDMLLLLSIGPSCLLTISLLIDDRLYERRRAQTENSLMDIVFDIGNRMLSGFNFEKASIDALSNNDRCKEMSESLDREYALCRGDIRSAIQTTIGNMSGMVSAGMVNIFTFSQKDPSEAGKMAVVLGRQMQSMAMNKRNIRLKLKSTTDMMIGTTMLFAPMILGMSLSLLEPLSKIGNVAQLEEMSPMLEIYLIELSALISVLVSSLGEDGGIKDILWRFCIFCPVSLLMFRIFSSITI